jgi:hypothetical protein
MKVFIALSTATLGAAAVALPLAADAGGAFGGARPAMMSAPMGESWHGTVINPDLIRGGSGFGSGVDSGDRNRQRTGAGVAKPDTRLDRATGPTTAKSDSRGAGRDVRQTEGVAPPK